MEYTIKNMLYSSPVTPEEELHRKQFQDCIYKALSILTKREIKVICLKFGLYLDPSKVRFSEWDQSSHKFKEVKNNYPLISSKRTGIKD